MVLSSDAHALANQLLQSGTHYLRVFFYRRLAYLFVGGRRHEFSAGEFAANERRVRKCKVKRWDGNDVDTVCVICGENPSALPC